MGWGGVGVEWCSFTWDHPLHETPRMVSGEGCCGKTTASQCMSYADWGYTRVLQHAHVSVCVCVCVWCAEPHPSFLTILMSLRSTLVAVLGSITFMTASTAMGASWEEYWDTT